MDKLNVIVCVDDVHPEKGWGCSDDIQTHLISELNKEYGVQFTLFIPSNYHSKYPLSENKDWEPNWRPIMKSMVKSIGKLKSNLRSNLRTIVRM